MISYHIISRLFVGPCKYRKDGKDAKDS